MYSFSRVWRVCLTAAETATHSPTFMQTFVLAPQNPKKYYVHKDIFRYEDEVFMKAAGDTSTGTHKDYI